MVGYLIRRVLHAILVIVIVSIAVFLLMRALPGDPIEMLVTSNALTEYSTEQIEVIRHEKGLDRPLVIQYLDWGGQMLRGDFGYSIVNEYEIGKQLKPRILVSMMLGIVSFLIGCLLGPLLGIICAIRNGKFIDNLLTTFANIGVTAPEFWIAILMIYVFSIQLGWLPLYGYTLPWDNFGLCVKQSILPVLVGALLPIAMTTRQTRSSVLEVLGEDYIRTAWAKGLDERRVLFKHVLKNSLMPVITLQGQNLRTVFGGSVIVETIFVIPGMGKFMIDGLQDHDYTVVQGVTVIFTVITVLCSLAVDILYVWVDPRIQYE